MSKPELFRLTALCGVLATSLAVAACGQNNKAAPAPAGETVAVTETTDQNVTPASGEWTELEAKIGETPSQSGLFDNSVITPALKTLLGDKFETFKTNMEVQGPLTQDGKLLWTSGNKQHAGGSDMAYLIIDPATKALEVGIWETGKLTTYQTEGANLAKPADIQTMISNAEA